MTRRPSFEREHLRDLLLVMGMPDAADFGSIELARLCAGLERPVDGWLNRTFEWLHVRANRWDGHWLAHVFGYGVHVVCEVEHRQLQRHAHRIVQFWEGT